MSRSASTVFVRMSHVIFSCFCCLATTNIALESHQEQSQVVYSNKKAQKRLTKSNSTPAMDLGHMNVVLK